MIVCIAEKPSVGRDIAQILGATSRHEGYMEGGGYQVTWTFGHLCELKEPHEYSPQWKIWALGALPMIPPRFGIRLKANKGVAEQFKVISSLMNKADYIVNCGDAGQEGELIQRWVIQMTGAKCPVKRLWINSLTPEAIREGFANLRDQSEYQSLYEAGLCRAVGDWLLGMNATRAYTLRYRAQRTQQGQVLSVGRVQTPTLALIVRRQEEIDNFKPTTYWVLTTVYRETTFTAVMKEGEKGYPSEEEAKKAFEGLASEPFTVTAVEKKKGSEAPPRLFDLTSLQVECNKRYDFSAELTLRLIQSLYEKKLTTYPRVDTTYLPDDVYPKCTGILNGLPAYFPLMERIKGKPLVKRKKVFDTAKVTDHHAIIPTGVRASGLTAEEGKVYDLVCRRFIGVFHPDCLFETTSVEGQVGETLFRTSGRHIVDPGWRTVVQGDKAGEGEKKSDSEGDKKGETEGEKAGGGEKMLPEFTKGESGRHTPSVAQKQTTPPKAYTEATLLRAMETAGKFVDDEQLRDALKENGIGRPSTRAAIIETLYSRHYIVREKKSLAPTKTGRELIGLIGVDLLKSAELTGMWERKLRLIEQHEYEAKQFVEELKEMVAEVVMSVLSDNSYRHVSAQ